MIKNKVMSGIIHGHVGKGTGSNSESAGHGADDDSKHGKLHDKLHHAKIDLIQFKHKIGKLGNIINTNHRHDEEHEKETDQKRSAIAQSHRFESFAPERPGNDVKFYVDGRDYFWVCL